MKQVQKRIVQGELKDGILQLKIEKKRHHIELKSEIFDIGDGIIHCIFGSSYNMGGDYLSINGGDLIPVNENKMTDAEYKESCFSIGKAINFTGKIDFV